MPKQGIYRKAKAFVDMEKYEEEVKMNILIGLTMIQKTSIDRKQPSESGYKENCVHVEYKETAIKVEPFYRTLLSLANVDFGAEPGLKYSRLLEYVSRNEANCTAGSRTIAVSALLKTCYAGGLDDQSTGTDPYRSSAVQYQDNI